jgi:hypothetical protein
MNLEVNVTLHYETTGSIQRWADENPMDWGEDKNWRAKAIAVFKLHMPLGFGTWFRYLKTTGGLPTQEQFIELYIREHIDWWNHLDKETRECAIARAARQFFPSAVDSVFVYKLMIENSTGLSAVHLDVLEDAELKRDVSIFVGDERHRISMDLKGPLTAYQQECNEHKAIYRRGDPSVIIVQMPWRRKTFGNKRWFELGDFQHIFELRDHYLKAMRKGQLDLEL